MSVTGLQGGQTVLPASVAANEPKWVREGSPAVKHTYEEGVGFEEMLLERLTQSLASSAGLGGEGESESEEGNELSEGGGEGSLGAGSGLISSVLPKTLAESVIAGGGLGLADQMAHKLTEGPQ